MLQKVVIYLALPFYTIAIFAVLVRVMWRKSDIEKWRYVQETVNLLIRGGTSTICTSMLQGMVIEL